MSNKKNKGNKSLPTTIELFQGARSAIALSAITQTGAGLHADRRRAKSRKKSWKNEEW